MSDVNDFLMGGGGAPAAKFNEIGRTHKGRILASEMRQQTEMDGTLKFWKDGNPMMQAVITIQTDERDPAIEDDDGQRRLFVKGQMQQAVRDAVVAAGASRLEKGGTLAVQYARDGVAKNAGLSAPKQYVAEYRAPAVGVNDLVGTAQQPAMAAPAAPVGVNSSLI